LFKPLTPLHAADAAKIAAISSTAADLRGVVTIPRGDYELGGKTPLIVSSGMTVFAYGSESHRLKAFGD
jgi:hypothetical protein